jgi:cytochrome bd-type quinol oxidase subunit 2
MDDNIQSETGGKSISAAKIAVYTSIAALVFDAFAAIAVFFDANPRGTSLLDSYSSVFFTLLGWLVPLAGLVLGIVGKKEDSKTASKAILFSIASLIFFGAAYVFLPKIMLP